MNKTKTILIAIQILFVISLGIYFLPNVNLTGFVIYSDADFTTETINTNYKNSYNELDLPQNLLALKITGYYEGEGSVNIRLEDENISRIVYLSETEAGNLITGMVVENTTEPINETEINETIEVQETEETPETNTTEIIENITIEINETPEINITINETIEEPIINKITFENYCLETCDFPEITTSKLIIELEGDITFHLESISYVEVKPLMQLMDFNTIYMTENEKISVDLKDYFSSPNDLYYDVTTDFKKISVEQDRLFLDASKDGTYTIQVLATDGTNLLKSNEFEIHVGEEIMEEVFTSSTFLPWTNEFIGCDENHCCDETNSYFKGEEIKINNDKYICAIKESSNDWIKLEGGSFQIQDKNNKQLLIIDDLGNIWLKDSKCSNINNIELLEEKFANININSEGMMQIDSINENTNGFSECEECFKIKNTNNQVIAQITNNLLELKGTFYEQQITSTLC